MNLNLIYYFCTIIKNPLSEEKITINYIPVFLCVIFSK